MSNKPNILKGAKPLLQLTANNAFASLEIKEPTKAFCISTTCYAPKRRKRPWQ